MDNGRRARIDPGTEEASQLKPLANAGAVSHRRAIGSSCKSWLILALHAQAKMPKAWWAIGLRIEETRLFAR